MSECKVSRPICFATYFKWWVVSLVVLLTACTTPSRYHVEKDYGPAKEVDVSQVPDAEPRWEPYSVGGNQTPYEVLGETYHVLPTSKNFQQVGVGSWYGNKFHGHLTSNGEIYDMYAMTAAHKTLPIPSFLKVTNLENQRTVIVRVNDRGPFHEGRVIDLSYAAAARLGYHQKGTAKLRLESIDFDEPDRFVQIGAFSRLENAKSLKNSASQWANFEFRIKPEAGIYKVQIGPLRGLVASERVMSIVRNNGILKPLLLFDENIK
jgi:rare lipoprotein A